MTRLSHYTAGRDNNFNLIRILAALAVLVSHSFALAVGRGAYEPLSHWLGISSGTVAVDVFFITSGLLVTASLLRSRSIVEFASARILRIFPALWVMLALTVFGLGATVSTLGSAAYFSSAVTWHYLLKCATLVYNVSFELPGVFANNPYPDAVNGSLWSLPVEVRMYLVLAALWLLTWLARRWHDHVFRGACVLIALSAGALVLATHLHGLRDSAALRLIFMFFSGASLFAFRQNIRLSRVAFAACAALLVGAALVGQQAFFVAYLVGLPYIAIYLAYVPAGWIRRYNRRGDYSYGVYIYAFPVQQAIVAVQPGISVALLLLEAGAISLVCAALSWHLVEKRALALRRRRPKPPPDAVSQGVARTSDPLAPILLE